MIAVDFPESNVPFGPPPGLEESQCRSIRAYTGQIQGGGCDGLPCIVVAWQPGEAEIAAILAGAPIFLSMIATGLAPHFLSTSFEAATHPA